MPIPYAFVKVLKGDDWSQELEKLRGERMPKEQAEYLMQGKHMQGMYLGAALDSSRWGSTMTTLYEMSVKELVSFVQNWIGQNHDNFEKLFHERKIEELYKKFELPHIHHTSCPRDSSHKGLIDDLDGRTRCSQMTEQSFKPSYVTYWTLNDPHAGFERREYFEDRPNLPVPLEALTQFGELIDEAWRPEFDWYERETEKYEKEEATFVVRNMCSAIISDKRMILPLEEILSRLNLRSAEESKTEFPFDGWDLAFYVQRWHEQTPDVPLYNK